MNVKQTRALTLPLILRMLTSCTLTLRASSPGALKAGREKEGEFAPCQIERLLPKTKHKNKKKRFSKLLMVSNVLIIYELSSAEACRATQR